MFPLKVVNLDAYIDNTIRDEVLQDAMNVPWNAIHILKFKRGANALTLRSLPVASCYYIRTHWQLLPQLQQSNLWLVCKNISLAFLKFPFRLLAHWHGIMSLVHLRAILRTRAFKIQMNQIPKARGHVAFSIST